jgi:hypothetical protein
VARHGNKGGEQMSILAHAVYGVRNFGAEKRTLNATIQHEIREAKRIQAQVNCTWAEALRLARKESSNV